jgi:HSP20 family protein
MSLVRWNPFEEFDHVFKSRTPAFTRGGSLVADWAPSVDIVESDNEFLIKAELPEVKKEDIKVNVEHGVLTLSGERSSEKTDEKAHRTERFYGSFSRSFTLPENINKEDIVAENKDGMLYLHLPKSKPVNKSAFKVEVK